MCEIKYKQKSVLEIYPEEKKVENGIMLDKLEIQTNFWLYDANLDQVC